MPKNTFIMINIYEVMSQYGMKPLEAKAYKLSCLYNDFMKEMFPNYANYKNPKGDPRKTSLFKYCFKLVRETSLKDEELWMYIKAQFDIMKSIERNGFLPLIQPNCLVGEKAWKRWLVWKRHYDAKISKIKEENTEIENKDFVKASISHTKRFLEKRLGKPLTEEKIFDALEENIFQLWIATHQVDGYFAVLCKSLKNWLENKKLDYSYFNGVDLDFYKKSVDTVIEEYFLEKINV